jgi:hypothetical protein
MKFTKNLNLFLFISFILIIIGLGFKSNNNYKSLFKNKLKSRKFLLKNRFHTKTKFKSLFSFRNNLYNLKDMTAKKRYQGYPIVTTDSEMELGEGPIYYQGWEKYFVLLGKDKSLSDKKFLLNDEYGKEIENLGNSSNIQLNITKNDYIPDQSHYYFILTNEYLSVINSKIVKFYI